MRITLASILVEDQERALQFYTAKLGFKKHTDIPMGEFRWLTVSSPEGVAGVELVLEPIGFAPAKVYQKALYDAGIPATAFLTDEIASEYARLSQAGVRFRGAPKAAGPVTVAMFEDGCGNLINLVQTNA